MRGKDKKREIMRRKKFSGRQNKVCVITKPEHNCQWSDEIVDNGFDLKQKKIADYLSKIDFSSNESILRATLEQFLANDLEMLHRIDEKALEEAIILYRKDLAELSLIAYCLRKLLSKKHIFLSPNWKGFKEKLVSDMTLAIELSKKENKDGYYKKILEIEKNIEDTDKLLGHFIHDIVFNARAKIASTAYAYGLSFSQASNLLSADRDLLMQLIGETKLPDEDIKTKTISERVDFLKKSIPESKARK